MTLIQDFDDVPTPPLTSEQLIALAGENPEQAKQSAERLLEHAQGVDLVVALQALGIAERNLRNPQSSVDHLSRALEAHSGSPAPSLEQDREWLLRVDLAASLADLGDPERGLHALGGDDGPTENQLEAMTEATRARTEHGRGLMLQRIGRLDPAWQAYRRALDLYEQIDHQLGVGQINANLAVLATHQGLIEEALELSASAEAAYTRAGNEWWVAHTILNRGWTHGCGGNIPRALALLSEAEDRFIAMGIPDGLRLVTRAEVLLRAGLYQAARTDLLRAVDEFDRSNLGIDAAEALILAAVSAEMAGDVDEAIRLAETAVDRLRSQHRQGWSAAAGAAAFGIRCRALAFDGPIESTADQISVDLEAAGQQPSIPIVRLSAALALLDRGHMAAAERQIDLAGDKHATTEGRALATLVRARLHELQDEIDIALVVLDDGFDQLQRELQLFGAVDIAAMAASAVVRVVDQAKRLLAPTERSEEYLRWADRGRQIATWRWPRIHDPELEQLVKQARALSLTTGGSSGDQQQALAELRERIRDVRWRQGAEVPARPSTPVASDHRSSATVIDVSSVDETWVAVTANDGRTSHQLVELDPANIRAVIRLSRLFQTSTPAVQQQLMTQIRQAMTDINDLLASRLPEDPDSPVLIGIDEDLADLPWSALDCLWARPYSVLPTHRYLAERDGKASTRSGVSVVIGPGLASEAAEVEVVGRGDADLVDAHDFDTLARAFDRRVVHIAAHGGPEPDNPLFNWLEFDFGRVFLHDLMFLDVAPEIVVLAACYAGQTHRFGIGGTASFANGFLGVGSRWVVSASTALRDDLDMIGFASSVLGLIVDGVQPPMALAVSRRQLGAQPTNPAALTFTCFGG